MYWMRQPNQGDIFRLLPGITRQPSTRSTNTSQSADEDELELKHIVYPEHFAYHMGKGGQFKTKAPVDIDDPDAIELG